MSNEVAILVLEGPLSGGLATVLAAEGLETTVATSLQGLLLLPLVGEETRLIILDVLAPGVTPEAWQTLQGTYRGPVLLIAPTLGKLEGEVVTAPFEPEHLLRRVRELLESPLSTVVRVGELAIDLAARRVAVGGRRICLAPREYDVLAYLARHQGQAVSHDELLEEVWGYPPEEESYDLVRTCVKRLRRKLEEEPRQPQYLVTLWGVGYRLRSQAQWEEALHANRRGP